VSNANKQEPFTQSSQDDRTISNETSTTTVPVEKIQHTSGFAVPTSTVRPTKVSTITKSLPPTERGQNEPERKKVIGETSKTTTDKTDSKHSVLQQAADKNEKKTNFAKDTLVSTQVKFSFSEL
jgi:hypothetical protein